MYFHLEILPAYQAKDRKTPHLFPELFPFGGKLNKNNRWLRVAELIPWDELETEYAKKFSDMGRPATDGQLVIGLLLLKHMTGLSDEGVVTAVMENPYMQAFCGFEQFVTEEILNSSTLTKMRERLGLEFFKQLEPDQTLCGQEGISQLFQEEEKDREGDLQGEKEDAAACEAEPETDKRSHREPKGHRTEDKTKDYGQNRGGREDLFSAAGDVQKEGQPDSGKDRQFPPPVCQAD